MLGETIVEVCCDLVCVGGGLKGRGRVKKSEWGGVIESKTAVVPLLRRVVREGEESLWHN